MDMGCHFFGACTQEQMAGHVGVSSQNCYLVFTGAPPFTSPVVCVLSFPGQVLICTDLSFSILGLAGGVV